MQKILVLTVVVTLVCFSDLRGNSPILTLPNNFREIISTLPQMKVYSTFTTKQLNRIEAMLRHEGNKLNEGVINKVMKVLKCSQRREIQHNNILTIIDYSLPSDKKRLWVFDLAKYKLLFYTYVSHGIKSGTFLSTYFSNRLNSKTSSIGVYNTDKAYRGRHGLSLKLNGLDRGFNDNAYNRFIVMHGSWYVNENFVKKYGRVGRSWGCPTVPTHLTKPIINTMKDKTLLVVYYPFDRWFVKSKFLNCDDFAAKNNENIRKNVIKSLTKERVIREKILFADLNNDNKRDQNDPVIVVTAEDYQRLFNKKAPLKRMLRRQINKAEYIALSVDELKQLDIDNNNILDHRDGGNFKSIYFVITVVKLQRGYYATEMKIVELGKVKQVQLKASRFGDNDQIEGYAIHFQTKPVINLKASNRFIRWLGL